MCGIVGIAVHKSKVEEARLTKAVASLQHRGPDNTAHWISPDGGLAFAHQRLSIIDTRTCSHQPLHYADRLVIIYNGEIYNYQTLKKSLQQKGFAFHTESDTEVVAAAYIAFGEACVCYFEGAFAFAIWDRHTQQLFAARDRFGEKPFFYFYNDAEFLFASEMKALWQAGVSKEVNTAMLYNFLTIGYTSNPGNPAETFYDNILKLPAASHLRYNLKTHELTIEKYWNPSIDVKRDVVEKDVIEQFKAMLALSVQDRLNSDVPVGTSLSGGLDSSAIVALCSQQNNTQHYSHQCFTAVFPGFEKDETQYAAQVARQFGLTHNLVNVTESDLLQNMDVLMYHQEEPVTSASTLAQYKVYQQAKEKGITVLLDGQGADEILAGYHKYYKWYWQELYRQKNFKKSGEWMHAHQLGVQESFNLKHKAAALMPEFAGAMLQSSKAKKAGRLSFLNPDFAFAHKQALYYSLPTHPNLNGVLYYNTFVYGLEELLRMADRNSMAHGVEVRLPFLHHQLVEFLFTLPAHLKIREGWTKWLLRKSMEAVLPNEIVWRKDKVGFEPPQLKWMQWPAIQEQILESKKKLVEKGVLRSAALQQYRPHSAHEAKAFDWRFWSASYLFTH